MLLLRPGSADEDRMRGALERSSRSDEDLMGSAREGQDGWWEAWGLHPFSVLNSFPHGFGKPADDALVAVTAQYERAGVDALYAGHSESLAECAKLRALIAAIYEDKAWQEPLATACFNTTSIVPPFVPDLLTLVFPLSGMPRAEVTLVGEQLKSDRGRLVIAAVYESASRALAATRQLEARLRRWPLNLQRIWQGSWRDRYDPKALHRGSPQFRPLTLDSLGASVTSETLSLGGHRNLWVALAALTYPVEPLGPLAEGATSWHDTGNNERQIAAVRSNCTNGSWIFATETSGQGGFWLSDLPFE